MYLIKKTNFAFNLKICKNTTKNLTQQVDKTSIFIWNGTNSVYFLAQPIYQNYFYPWYCYYKVYCSSHEFGCIPSKNCSTIKGLSNILSKFLAKKTFFCTTLNINFLSIFTPLFCHFFTPLLHATYYKKIIKRYACICSKENFKEYFVSICLKIKIKIKYENIEILKYAF